MREKIARLSIRTKLLVPTMSTLLVTAVFIFLYYPAQQKSQALRTLEAKALGMGEIISLNMAFGLARDMSAVAEAFRVAQSDSTLSYIVVLDTADVPLGVYNPGGVALELSGLSGRHGVFARYGLLNVATPIRYQDREFGTLGLGFTLKAIDSSVTRGRVTAVLMSLALLIGGGTLAIFLGNLIAKPILDLHDAAEQVSSGNFDVAVPVHSTDEVGALAKAFNRMTETLESTMTARAKLERLATIGQLTATVSHELRNPLGTISTSVDLIRERTRDGDPAMERTLDRVDRSVARCDAIIAELLDFAKTGNLELETTEFDPWLETLFREEQFPEAVTFWYELHTGAVVSLDRERFRRVVINLVNNACQALTSDGRGAPDDRKIVTVATRLEREDVVFSISDNGPGIPADVLPEVFEPLFTTKTKGVGLGLTVVKNIIEQHGGTVMMTNVETGGARVDVRLPLERPAT